MENQRFKEIVQNLVNRNEYFTVSPAQTRRIIGINDDGFRIQDSMQMDRENIHCFSTHYSFLKEQEEKRTGHRLDPVSNEKLFHKVKDSLSDLTWVITGYY